jgi:hypothetical protein
MRSSAPETIDNWYALDRRVTTSGQPTGFQLVILKDLVRHVINLALHTHAKALRDEAASVSALGIAYVHIQWCLKIPRCRISAVL